MRRIWRARGRGFAALVVALAALSLGGCASAPKRHFDRSDFEASPVGLQRGYASWYGPGYKGRKTASGEKFNAADLTAAHRTLSLGTVVEVRNLNNGRKVLVEITDRGPFVDGRIIDLSEGAAKALGMKGAGVVPVELRVLRRR